MTPSLLYVKAGEPPRFPLPSTRGILSATDTQGAFLLWEQHVLPGGGTPPPPGGTPGQWAYYVLRGSCAFHPPGATLLANEGDVIHLPSGEPCAYEQVGEDPADLLALAVAQPAAGPPRHIEAGQGRALAIVYDVGVFKLTGQETAGAFLLVEWHVPPGRGVPLHAQAGQETFYIVEGRFSFRGQDAREPDTWVAQRGDVIHVPQRVPHSYKNIGERPGKMLVLMAPVGKTMQYFEEIGFPVAHASSFPTSPPDLARLLASVQKYRVDVFAASPDDV